jgi:Fe-S-cluster containining protein
MRTSSFTRKYCDKEDGEFYLKLPKQDCLFLVGKRCSVYQARPTQCRTWPFWPENMKPSVWRAEVAPFCAGVGKGRLYSAQEIAGLLALHRRSSFSANRR